MKGAMGSTAQGNLKSRHSGRMPLGCVEGGVDLRVVAEARGLNSTERYGSVFCLQKRAVHGSDVFGTLQRFVHLVLSHSFRRIVKRLYVVGMCVRTRSQTDRRMDST